MVEWLVIVILGLSALVGMVITAYYCSSFWQDFFPNFFSDLLVGILIAGLVSWLLSRIRKVEAKVVAHASPVNESTVNLEFSVENTGRVSFKADEIYWHVFVDDRLNVERVEGNAGQVETPLMGRVFKHFRGLLKSPAFTGRKIDLFSLKVRLPRDYQYDLYYLLSTAHGLFPKGLKTDKQGRVVPETLGKIELLSFGRTVFEQV